MRIKTSSIPAMTQVDMAESIGMSLQAKHATGVLLALIEATADNDEIDLVNNKDQQIAYINASLNITRTFLAACEDEGWVVDIEEEMDNHEAQDRMAQASFYDLMNQKKASGKPNDQT